MATITAAAVTPVLAPFNTTPSYSGTFIPSVWSSKLNVSDVLDYQAQPNLMDMFTTDAANQMKIQVYRECLQAVVTGCDPANVGATAGKISGSYSFGTDAVPVVLTGGTTGNILQTITAMASALDEQNVPETDRFLILTPVERNMLMSSN